MKYDKDIGGLLDWKEALFLIGCITFAFVCFIVAALLAKEFFI